MAVFVEALKQGDQFVNPAGRQVVTVLEIQDDTAADNPSVRIKISEHLWLTFEKGTTVYTSLDDASW